MIKKLIKRLLYGHRCDSETFIRFLRKQGCIIGENTTIYSAPDTVIDITRPFMIEIGDNVEITAGCTILTHGYDWSVLKGKYGDVLGSSGKVVIGNNVFIGVNTTILKGSHIGNNVIIGANSLVNRDIPDNVVASGNPIRVICTLEEYYQKRQSKQLEEAVELFWGYCDRYQVEQPPVEIFREFFWLFNVEMEGDLIKNETLHAVMELGDTTPKSYETYRKKPRRFPSYDAFVSYCKGHEPGR